MKQAGFIWNRTVFVFVDKLKSTAVDFIRSERELKNCTYMGSRSFCVHAQNHLGGVKGKWALLELWGQLGFLEGGVGIIDIVVAIIIIIDMPF